jgi:signal transduction histidine kinase
MTMQNTQLMRILMLDLLDLAQLENQTFKINLCEIDLFDVVRQAIVIVKHYASLKNITFDTNFDE